MDPTIFFTTPGTFAFQSTCTYPDGTAAQFQWAFVITAPTGEIDAQFPGQPNFYKIPRIALGQPTFAEPGIAVGGTAINGTPVDGFLAMMQLVQPNRFVGLQPGQRATPCPANGRWIVDNPVCPMPNALYVPPVALPRGESATVIMEDAPWLTLTGFGTAISAGVQAESFQTILMFMPATPAAIWIPLAQVNWQWTCNAYVVSGGWVTFGTHTATATKVTPTFPQWADNVCPYGNWGNWGIDDHPRRD